LSHSDKHLTKEVEKNDVCCAVILKRESKGAKSSELSIRSETVVRLELQSTLEAFGLLTKVFDGILTNLNHKTSV
jgi:hypothetical protein